MKLSILLAAVLLTSGSLAIAKKSSPLTTEARSRAEILNLEKARNQAITRGDAAALERMTSDDYTFITLRGEMRTKAEIVQGFKTGSFHYDSRQISDLNVRVFGASAVVTGRSTQKGTENGKDYSGDYRFTRVYVKRQGRWQTVALQATLIQP